MTGRDLGLGSGLSWVSEVRGRVADVARDTNNYFMLGCELLRSSPAEVALVAAEIIYDLQSLSVHRHGHFVVIKLVEVVDQWRLANIFYTLLSDNQYLITICTDEYGSRVMMRLVERLKGDIPKQHALMESLCRSDSRAVTLNSWSTFFLENCFLNFSYHALRPLIIDVSGNIMELAMNESGHSVLIQCISALFRHRADDECLFRTLIGNIIPLSYYLASNSYGEEVVKHVIEQRSLNSEIFYELKGRLSSMCTSGQGSYVVRKLLLCAENFIIQLIVEEIMEPPSVFLRFCTDSYGSYVVEDCIKQTKLKGLSVYGRLANFIKMNEEELGLDTHGVKLVNTMLLCDKIFSY